MINGDGKALPPKEAEYEKIEIYSNSVPIEAYLKLKQMLVDSDNRIQELLAANQDLKEEVSLLQNMVQTLMEENVVLRKVGGGGGGGGQGANMTNGVNHHQQQQHSVENNSNNGVMELSELNSLTCQLQNPAASAVAWTPEMQRRMAAFQRALMRDVGGSSQPSINCTPPNPAFSNPASSTLDMYRPSTPTNADQLVIFNNAVNNGYELRTLISRYGASANYVFSRFNILIGQELWFCFVFLFYMA